MAVHLTLLCHAATRPMRAGAFPRPDEALDDGGLSKAAKSMCGAGAAVWLTSPARAARQTAEALAAAPTIDEALRDIDHGPWAGRTFAEVQASDPSGLAAWIAAPAQGAPGGESLDEVCARIAPWLNRQAQAGLSVAAVSHPMVIRAALASALGLPALATLRIDIAPLSATELSFNGVWRLQSIRPAGG